jgi:hypothetical protein
MPTIIYDTDEVLTVENKRIELSPLKIKYMRKFMNVFQTIDYAMSDEDAIDTLSECARICMEQFAPEYSDSVQSVQDTFDLKAIYHIMNIAGGIRINDDSQESVRDQAQQENEDSTWDTLDLVKLETEVFLLGIWKNYDELEKSLCMQELMAILSSRRELDFEEKKFLAAIQGIDLDGEQDRGQKEWEDMKARVFSGGATGDANDILALQGINAQKAGFGIGMGIDYEVVKG